MTEYQHNYILISGVLNKLNNNINDTKYEWFSETDSHYGVYICLRFSSFNKNKISISLLSF